MTPDNLYPENRIAREKALQKRQEENGRKATGIAEQAESTSSNTSDIDKEKYFVDVDNDNLDEEEDDYSSFFIFDSKEN